jgi:hypothetical protein
VTIITKLHNRELHSFGSVSHFYLAAGVGHIVWYSIELFAIRDVGDIIRYEIGGREVKCVDDIRSM